MSDLVENPVDWFSRVAAHMMILEFDMKRKKLIRSWTKSEHH